LWAKTPTTVFPLNRRALFVLSPRAGEPKTVPHAASSPKCTPSLQLAGHAPSTGPSMGLPFVVVSSRPERRRFWRLGVEGARQHLSQNGNMGASHPLDFVPSRSPNGRVSQVRMRGKRREPTPPRGRPLNVDLATLTERFRKRCKIIDSPEGAPFVTDCWD
jgi:hypothetical protein